MKDMLLKLWVKAQILKEDKGQDLIEYALLAALVATAAVAAINGVGSAVKTVFTNLPGKFTPPA